MLNGLRSGLCAGQSRSEILSRAIQFFVSLAVWQLALSSWKMYSFCNPGDLTLGPERYIVGSTKATFDQIQLTDTALIHAAPDHQATTAVLQSWLHTIIPVCLSRPASNIGSTIVPVEEKPRLIAEDDSTPVRRGPVAMFPGKLQPLLAVREGEPGLFSGPVGLQTHLPQSSLHALWTLTRLCFNVF